MIWLMFLFSTALMGDGTTPKPKAADYPAHSGPLGAEYLVHSVLRDGQSVITKDYLVVEAALYPGPGQTLTVSAGAFRLRINGAKHPIYAQTPGFVAASVKYDDWTQRPSVVASAGAGNAGVIVGRPRTSDRFPGDPTSGRTRLPAPPRAPGQEDRSGLDAAPPSRAEDVVMESALPEGEFRGAVSGYLYFAFKGKPRSIRTLELIYKTGEGDIVLPLIPAP